MFYYCACSKNSPKGLQVRHPDVRTDLAAASSSYRDALSQFKLHQQSLRSTLDAILPESQKARFQKYLDYKKSQDPIFVNGSLGLPLIPPAALMAWGAETEEKLSNTHGKTDHLRERVFVTLSDALYALGYTAPEWVAPSAQERNPLAEPGLTPHIRAIYRLAREYRRDHLDGKDVLTSDGPFVNGLAKRLGVKPDRIFEKDTRVSAFEMAYWAIREDQHTASEDVMLQC